MSAFGIFELSELETITGIDSEKLRNWTKGRPLKILPFKGAGKRGLRNLFSKRDIYIFVLAFHMMETGVAPELVRQTLAEYAGEQADPFDRPKAAWLTIFGKKKQPQIKFIRAEEPPSIQRIERGSPHDFVFILIHLRRLHDEIDQRINDFHLIRQQNRKS